MINIMQKLLRFVENLIVNYQNYKILKFLNTEKFKNILDVGGHHGEFYKSLLNNNIDFNKYLIFEPSPESFNIIDKIEDQRLEKYNIGIGKAKSSMMLNISQWETSNTFSEFKPNTLKNKLKKILYKSDSYISKIEVEVNTLDEICSKYQEPFNLLKIDVEGFELQVLQGAIELFNNNKIEIIIIEIQKEGSYIGYFPSEIKDFLENNGFKLEKRFRIFGLGIEDRIYKKHNNTI